MRRLFRLRPPRLSGHRRKVPKPGARHLKNGMRIPHERGARHAPTGRAPRFPRADDDGRTARRRISSAKPERGIPSGRPGLSRPIGVFSPPSRPPLPVKPKRPFPHAGKSLPSGPSRGLCRPRPAARGIKKRKKFEAVPEKCYFCKKKNIGRRPCQTPRSLPPTAAGLPCGRTPRRNPSAPVNTRTR